MVHRSMPELAEVEHSRRTWDPGVGQKVLEVSVPRVDTRVLRGVDVERLRDGLTGQKLVGSEARGKQMCFRFGARGERWLGIHLGMRGMLSVAPPRTERAKHDLLVLRQARRELVFTDLRHFGRIRFHRGSEAPDWWASLPPALDSDEFTRAGLDRILQRSRRSLKALLLDQSKFPGVGNWMADEIAWRARLHPARVGAELDTPEAAALYRATRYVARQSVRTMDADWEYPKSWLFAHRWEDGNACPRCHTPLVRQVLAGRKTCFCPSCQRARGSA